jgi:predicted TIM-barrel fold metal-dependent hydrolase
LNQDARVVTGGGQDFDVAGSDLFLPEPSPREVRYTIISVDDHLVEPPGMFEGRVESRLQDEMPRIIETPEGHQVWEFEGQRYTQIGMNAVAGRRFDTIEDEPFRFDQMRRGCWDIDARVHDMDINGVWASMNFPSLITGFCGRVFSQAEDPEVGLAATRAWNDWLFDEWYSPYPERIIPLGITFLSDPEKGADEIRRNAARGFRSVTLPDRPHWLGYPSLFTDYWDPIIEACVETETVVCLHFGSGGVEPQLPEGPFFQLATTTTAVSALYPCAEWLWSGYPVRHPDLKITMTEGGIGWVATMLDRLDNIVSRGHWWSADTWGLPPSEIVRRNFWFCTIDDPSTIDTRHRIGVENIMLEVDYPHADTTWPDTQSVVAEAWGHIPETELRSMCCENAAQLYRHPLPADVRP